VSSSGFTEGAIQRGKKEGITLLKYSEITKNNTKDGFLNALKATMFIVLIIEKIIITNNNPVSGLVNFAFYNLNREIQGTLQDIVYQNWIKGNINTNICSESFQFEVPKGWFQFNGNELERVDIVIVETRKFGLLFQTEGSYEAHTLANPENGRLAKIEGEIHYEESKPENGLVSLKRFDNESEIIDLLKKYKISFLFKAKVPRIVYGSLYWPPSDKSLAGLNDYFKANNGKINREQMIANMTLEKIEGREIGAAFVAPSKSYLQEIDRIIKQSELPE
jgi:hypothetical protein